MEKLKKSKVSGITLISLVVTVIVLLILAGISVTMLTGDNGIILNAGNAKERADINREKEIIGESTLEATNKDKFGDLTLVKFSKYLGTNSNDEAEVELVDGVFYVTFKNTGRIYKVDKDGNIEYKGTYSQLVNTATIAASPEKNEYPMISQSTEITISTIIKKQDDEVIVHYGWSNDKNTEPTNYRPLIDYTTISERKRKGTAIIEDAEGSYYLWVHVLLDNNVVTQKFGPYRIKSHTSLVATSGENVPTSGFLGSNKFEKSKVVTRSTINSVKILDTFTDDKGVTHTINDSNCWDVSVAQDGKSILAWYETAFDSEGNEVKNASENTMYNITIAQEGGVTAAVNSSCLFYNLGQGGTGIDVITGLEHLDTSMTTSMGNMFKDCAMKNIDLSNINTSKVTNMNQMFYNCSKLESLDVSSFNTSQVTDMTNMFNRCRELTTLDLNSFDTSKVVTMSAMFNVCTKLTSLDLRSFNTDKVTNLGHIFRDSPNLEDIDISSFNTSNVTNMSYMFSGCTKLKNLSINIDTFNTGKVTTMTYMFSGCSGLNSLDVSKFNTSSVTSMANMFKGCSRLNSLNLNSFNTSSVTNMGGMFQGCSGLISLDLSSFNTSKVTTMSSMFQGCSGLTNLNLSSFNTSSVTTMASIFLGCSALTSLDLNNFNTSSVTTMFQMFQGCSGLTNLNIGSFNTSSVTTMYQMFNGCSGLTNLNVSSFNTSNVTTMYMMFYKCSSLVSLDLTSFDTSKVTSMNTMFRDTSSMTQILVSNLWVIGENTNVGNMFFHSGVSSVTYQQ